MTKRLKKKVSVVLMIVVALMLFEGCGNKKAEENAQTTKMSEEDKYGGEITVAFATAPANLDSDQGTSWETTAVTNHVYEGLFESNAEGEAVPYLAEDYSISEDGKVYTINLRKGVLFSDGSEMTAEDVKASLERWLNVNAAGISVRDKITSVEITGDYQIQITLNEVYAPLVNTMESPVSSQKMVVRKKSIIDKFGADIITEHIGTGPYMFEEISLNQKVVLVRNEYYTPAEGELSGLAGKRTPYLDKITIEFVPEESVRIAGLESGLYNFADEISTDRYKEIEEYSGISPVICKTGTISVIAFNCGSAPFDNKELRQAVAYAIDNEALAKAQVGDQEFWSVEDGSWFKKGSIWYDESAGDGIYNAKDSEKAKELVAESGYDGAKITIMADKSDLYTSNGALVLQDQLKKIGINAEVEVYDTATYDDYRAAGKWNIVFSRWSDMNPDPQVFEPWTGTNGWITGWNDEDSAEMDQIFENMSIEMDQSKRYEIVKQFYSKFWESVPYLKSFNDVRIHAISDKVQGFQAYGQSYFWSVWTTK